MKDATDTLGSDGTYFDPLWRLRIDLTPLEMELLRSWWVRRLQFISHAGAAAITTTQTYSRLEHSLGVFALAAHFTPHDSAARVAALLHDIGHLPFSHTFEGLGGLNHHLLGRERIMSLDAVLQSHGLTADHVIAVEEGTVQSCLRGAEGHLRLDHLDSFLRSGQAHGRTHTSPADLLTRLRLIDGGIDTDSDTAQEIVALIIGEAHGQRSAVNVVPYTVLRNFADSLLDRHDPIHIAAMTDDEFWSVLLADPVVGTEAARFRRMPQSWIATAVSPTDSFVSDHADELTFTIRRSYLDLPTVGGNTLSGNDAIEILAQALPLQFRVRNISSKS